jgi:hypothetical protein
MATIDQIPAQIERDRMSRSGTVVPFRREDQEAAKVKEALEIFRRLNDKVRECAGDISKGFDRMLPFLDELEPVMSRKRKNKIPGLAGLPPWLVYLEELGKEFDIGTRQIQRRLREYRGKVTASRSGGSSPTPMPAAPRWTLRQQRQVAKALDVAKGAIEAIKGGKPVKPFIREWDAVAYTPTEPPNVDPVTGFVDTILIPYAVAILKYVRALEDIAYHAKGLSEEQDHRLWQYKQDFYNNAPPELKEVSFKARKIINAAKPTVSSDGTPIEGGVQVPEAAPNSSAPSTTRTVQFAVANDTLLGHTVKLVEETTPPGKYTVKVAMVDESHLTLPPTIEQRVRQVSA